MVIGSGDWILSERSNSDHCHAMSPITHCVNYRFHFDRVECIQFWNIIFVVLIKYINVKIHSLKDTAITCSYVIATM